MARRLVRRRTYARNSDRLLQMRTLGAYASEQKWDFGEGFIEGSKKSARPSDHVGGKPLLDSEGLTLAGVDESAIIRAPKKSYERPRTKGRFTPPMLLIREHMDIPHVLWTDHYLTYAKQIVGFPVLEKDAAKLRQLSVWLSDVHKSLAAYIALIGPRLFTQKATALQADDIYLIPYPENRTLDLSTNEKIVLDDIIDYQRDLIRLGDESAAMEQGAKPACHEFSRVFVDQINSVYKKKPLQVLDTQAWPGVVCQAFAFGKAKVDWNGVDGLQARLAALLSEQRGTTLRVTRISRIYDGNFIFLLKPDRLRYWLRSVALRDADETLSELRAQGL
jgi:hypothetical protein